MPARWCALCKTYQAGEPQCELATPLGAAGEVRLFRRQGGEPPCS